MHHVSASPPFIPEGRISRIRLAATAFPREPSRKIRRLSVRSHTPLNFTVISPARHILQTIDCIPVLSPDNRLEYVRHLPRVCKIPYSIINYFGGCFLVTYHTVSTVAATPRHTNHYRQKKSHHHYIQSHVYSPMYYQLREIQPTSTKTEPLPCCR